METKSGKAANYMSTIMFQNYPYNPQNRESFSDAGQPQDTTFCIVWL